MKDRPGPSRQGAAYAAAMEAVFAILIAIGIGYFADERLGTTPWFMLAGVVLGFAAFVLRLWRFGARIQKPEDEEPASRRDS